MNFARRTPQSSLFYSVVFHFPYRRDIHTDTYNRIFCQSSRLQGKRVSKQLPLRRRTRNELPPSYICCNVPPCPEEQNRRFRDYRQYFSVCIYNKECSLRFCTRAEYSPRILWFSLNVLQMSTARLAKSAALFMQSV